MECSYNIYVHTISYIQTFNFNRGSYIYSSHSIMLNKPSSSFFLVWTIAHWLRWCTSTDWCSRAMWVYWSVLLGKIANVLYLIHSNKNPISLIVNMYIIVWFLSCFSRYISRLLCRLHLGKFEDVNLKWPGPLADDSIQFQWGRTMML